MVQLGEALVTSSAWVIPVEERTVWAIALLATYTYIYSIYLHERMYILVHVNRWMSLAASIND